MDGVTNISANGQVYHFVNTTDAKRQQAVNAGQGSPITPAIKKSMPEQEALQQLKKDLQSIVPSLNQRLEYNFNKDLGQVVVKIIDRQTDTVIKELPPTEFQRVHLAIRETLGLLIDKQV